MKRYRTRKGILVNSSLRILWLSAALLAVAAGAIPGTIHIPLGELRSRLNELPRDKEIWVHCAVGQTAYYAARILKQNGFDVRNISGGFVSYKMEEKE